MICQFVGWKTKGVAVSKNMCTHFFRDSWCKFIIFFFLIDRFFLFHFQHRKQQKIGDETFYQYYRLGDEKTKMLKPLTRLFLDTEDNSCLTFFVLKNSQIIPWLLCQLWFISFLVRKIIISIDLSINFFSTTKFYL